MKLPPKLIVLVSLLLVGTGWAEDFPSDRAAAAFRGEAGFSWVVKSKSGWPELHRPYFAAPLALYRDWTLACYSIRFSANGRGEPRLVETAWDHQKIAYGLPDGKTASLIISRLTPAVLLESEGSIVALDRPEPYELSPPRFSFLPLSEVRPASPRFVAFVSDGQVTTRSTSNLNDVTLDEPWMLLWYGADTHLQNHWNHHADPAGPVFGGRAGAEIMENLRPIDLPVLIRFERKPESVSFHEGIVFRFRGASGRMAVLPLFGGRLFAPETTEQWQVNVPDEVITQCRLWARHLRDYPLSVRESFDYDKSNDVLTIRQQVKFLEFQDDWNSESCKSAPIPPMAALAQDSGFPIRFVTDGVAADATDMNFVDTPGKVMLLPGSEEYAIQVHGLADYVLAKQPQPAVASGVASAIEKLESHIAEMTKAGRLRPLIFAHAGVAMHLNQSCHFASSAECVDAVKAAWPYLSADVRGQALEYIKAELEVNPPFQPAGYTLGANRAPYEIPDHHTAASACRRDRLEQQMNRFRDVLLFEKLRQVTGVQLVTTADMKTAALTAADDLLKRQDWALCGPGTADTVDLPKYYDLQGEGVYNSWLAGAFGFARIAATSGWREEPIAWYLAGKLAMARLGQTQYLRAMYDAGCIEGALDDDWRCLVHIDPRCVILGRGNVDMRIRSDQEIPKFYNLTPEVAALLRDFARQDCTRYLDQLDHSVPFYWISESTKLAATEHRQAPLHWKGGAVLAQYWIAGKRGNAFLRYVDTTRFRGDYFYIQNMAALIESHRGVGK